MPAVERRRPGRREALGRDDEAVALALQPAADDLLGAARGVEVAAQRIGVGGVEEVDAALGGVVQDRDRCRLVALQAERHRAEAEPRDLQAGTAKTRMFHIRDASHRAAQLAGYYAWLSTVFFRPASIVVHISPARSASASSPLLSWLSTRCVVSPRSVMT